MRKSGQMPKLSSNWRRRIINTSIIVMLFSGIVLVSSLTGCSDPQNASRVLTQNGMTNVHITGYRWFGCSEDDLIHTGFAANSPSGQRVSGVVCSGVLFKGATIRFD